MSRIALLGPKAMVTPLAASGIDVFACDSALQGGAALNDLAEKGEHTVVFMTERLAEELQEDIASAETREMNIVLLPDHAGSIGLFKEALVNLMKRATGASQI